MKARGLRLVLFVLVIAGLAIAARQLPKMDCAELRARADSPTGVALVFGLGLLVVAGGFPRLAYHAGAGLALGFGLGALVSQAAALTAAVACFLVARTIAREPISRWLGQKKWFEPLARAIAERGAVLMVWLRVSPIFHFTGVSYAAGLLQLSLGGFLIGTLIGMTPGALIFSYAGEVIGCAMIDDAATVPRKAQLLLGAAAALMAIGSLWPLAKAIRKR